MNIIITGSEGHIGSFLRKELEKQGHNVFGIDLIQNYRANYIIDDVKTLNDSLSTLIAFKPDIVFHLAAMVSRVSCEKSPSLTIATNVLGTMNVINLCKITNAKLINFSTSEVYGDLDELKEEYIQNINPNNLYGLSKKMAEDLVKYETSLNAPITVRPFMIYSEFERMGENKSVLIRFIEAALTKNNLIVHKNSSRAWLHLEDAVKLFIQIMEIPNKSHITINVGNNKETIDTIDLAKKVCSLCEVDHEKLIKEIELPSQMTLHKHATFSKLHELTTYQCKVSLDEGIKRVLSVVKSKLNN